MTRFFHPDKKGFIFVVKMNPFCQINTKRNRFGPV